MKRLNGWQRIWLVASIVWATLAALYVGSKIQTEAQLLEVWARFVAMDVVQRKMPDQALAPSAAEVRQRHGDLSAKQFIERIPTLYPDVDFKGTLALYESDYAELRWNQFLGILLLLIVAALPPVFAYGMGLVVAWIRRGFKEGRE